MSRTAVDSLQLSQVEELTISQHSLKIPRAPHPGNHCVRRPQSLREVVAMFRNDRSR